MATTSPLQAVPLPQSTDPDNVPADLAAAVNALESRGVMRFATVAARSAAIPSPIQGMTTWCNDIKRLDTYDGTAWQRTTDRPDATTVKAFFIARSAGGNLLSGITAETVISGTYYTMASVSMIGGHYYRIEAEVDGSCSDQSTAATIRIRKTSAGGYMVREKVINGAQGVSGGRFCCTITGIYYCPSTTIDTFIVTAARAWGTGTLNVGTYPNPSDNNPTWMLVQDLGTTPWSTLT